jgi:hypothetical protein
VMDSYDKKKKQQKILVKVSFEERTHYKAA